MCSLFAFFLNITTLTLINNFDVPYQMGRDAQNCGWCSKMIRQTNKVSVKKTMRQVQDACTVEESNAKVALFKSKRLEANRI